MDIGYRRPRELIPPDVRLVMEAATILRLREFDLFCAAWQSWFGRAPDDRSVERAFIAYMFHQHVPHWLRHFARRVIEDRSSGEITASLPGGVSFPRQEPLIEPGEGYVTALSIAAAILCMILVA